MNAETDKYLDEVDLEAGVVDETETPLVDSVDESHAFEGDGSDVAHDEGETDSVGDGGVPVPLADKPEATGAGGDNWEHRAKIAEGRLRSQGQEVAQLRAQLAQFQSGLSQTVEQVIAQREAALKAQAEKEKARHAARSKVLETFDEDTLTALDQYYQSTKPETAPAPIANSQTQQVVPMEQLHAMRAEVFEADVLDAVPDYAEVISNPEFQSWGQQVDSASGATFYDLMVQARTQMQAGRLIGMMQRFKADVQTTQQRKQALQSQVSPGRSRAGTAQPATPQYLNPQQIEQYRADFRRGKYREQAMWDKWSKIEKLINLSEKHMGIA
ncbi:hypothetical protein [Thiothrix winogradskyi]|uniref:Uncharacterized protein n=1 Tax=Thiothrix winogradskyi TaxID=96472 RepID=A0ABY3T4X4_9GAMM|nr:hypothetical protein [Thiothrix winogradskyi]UJS26279.1 hypothetical protein L2Y54_09630 [Thiothrix winogradskyi]